MAVGARLTSFALVSGLAGCRCGDHPPGQTATPLESTIAQQLGRRAGASMTVHCEMMPPHCTATAPDGTAIPIALASEAGTWTWRVDGLFVRADELEAQVHAALDEVGLAQGVQCGARVRRIAVDDRIECALERGGRAFVVVHADGSTALELTFDPVGAAARTEAVTPARDQALEQSSHALESAESDEGEAQ